MIDPGSIIIILLCLGLLIISITLEIIKIKIMRKKSEQIKREILIFCTLLGIAMIVLIVFVKVSQLGILESVIIGDSYSGHGTANVGGAIESIMQFITLIIITLIAIKPLIYIIKQRKDCKNNNQKEEKNGK